MTHPVSRSVVLEFLQIFARRDTARLAAMLDEDVEWIIVGPVDILRYCGVRRGKAAVIDLWERIAPSVFQVTSLDYEAVLVDGDRSAMLGRITGVRPGDGRAISYHCTQFLRFRAGRIVEYRSIIDSFDAAEQVVGHQFEFKGQMGLEVGVVAV
jgi:ketosteroid isomerase-like protein